MADPLLPSARQPYTDQGGHATNPFHAWCSAVDRALRSGTLSTENLLVQMAAFTAELEAMEPGLPLSTAVVGSPGIGVSGSLAAGAVILAPDHDLGAIEGLSTFGFAVRTAADTWTTRAQTGTLDRITVTNGDGVAGAPTFDIAATYAGQTSITTLGTVTTGEWNATRITNANLAQINSKRFKGRTSGGVGDVEDLSVGTVQGMLGIAAPLAAMTLVGNNTGASATAQAALTVAEVQAMLGTGAGLTSSITNGDTTHAPTGDAVFDALALKAPLYRPQFDDWLGVGMAPDRPFVLNTASNPLAAGSSSFLVVGDSNKERLEMRSSGAGDPIFQGKRSGGTAAVSTATTSGSVLVALGGSGHDGSAWVSGNRGLIQLVASELWTGTAQGCRAVIATTTNGGTSRTDRWEASDAGHLRPVADNTYDIGSAAQRASATYSRLVYFGGGTTFLTSGAGTPEGVVVAPVGSMFTRTDGGATTTLYVKTSGTGNTGWTAK